MTKQYKELCQRIVDEGIWVENKRTGKRCLTVINADLVYDVGAGHFPLVSSRKSFWKAAVAELLGYIRGYDHASDFRAIGTKTWDANSTAEAWHNNPNRLLVAGAKNSDDVADDYMGRVYGVQGRDWRKPIQLATDTEGYVNSEWKDSVDQLRKIVDDLKNGIDDRGEILMMWNPGELDMGCLRPCLYSYHFSILGGELHLHATQRSCDVPLGLNFNMVQVYVFLAIMAKVTGLKPGKAYHKIVNAHIYEDQLELMRDVQLQRTVPDDQYSPNFYIGSEVNSFEDLETWVTPDNFEIGNYYPQDPIKYPFSV